MRKILFVLLCALVLGTASACSSSPGNPNSPTPVTPPGGGSGNTVASINTWGLYPVSACSPVTCDPSQKMTVDSNNRYVLRTGAGIGYRILVVFDNPAQPGRVIQVVVVGDIINPRENSVTLQQSNGGASNGQLAVQLPISANGPPVPSVDGIVKVQATEQGPGASGSPMGFEFPITVTR